MPYKDPEAAKRNARERTRARRKANPTKDREANRRYREKHRDELNARQRETSAHTTLKYKHRWTPEGRAEQWEKQRGACYLCGDPLRDGTKQVHIDHDHTHCPQGYSCAVCRRGLACHRCNLLIGLAKDDPGLLRRIADRLEAAKGAVVARKAEAPQQEELPLNVTPIRREATG